MLGLPKSTEFNKRLPKQKFYENLTITPALKKRVIDDIRIIYWRNKIAASTMNLAAGQMVTEIEVFEIRWNTQTVNEAILRQIDREIPYHILFLMEYGGKYQAWIGYKEATAGNNAFKVERYYHTDWLAEDELTKEIVDIAMNCVDQKNKAEILFTNIDVYGADDLPRKFNELGGQYADLVDRTKRHEVLLSATQEHYLLAEYLEKIGYITSKEEKTETQFDPALERKKTQKFLKLRVKKV